MAKKWRDLTAGTRRKYERQGVTEKGYNSARRAKSWKQLSPKYRHRLEANGVTEERWKSPVWRSLNPQLFQQARGHAPELFSVARARERNIEAYIPDFARRPAREKAALAELYQRAFFTSNMDRVIAPDIIQRGTGPDNPTVFNPTRNFRFGNDYIPAKDRGGIGPGQSGWVAPEQVMRDRLLFLRTAEALGFDIGREAEEELMKELYRELARADAHNRNFRPIHTTMDRLDSGRVHHSDKGRKR